MACEERSASSDFEQVDADLLPGHVERVLAAAGGLVGRAEHPVGMGAVEVAVAIDHLRFDPEAEGHAEFRHTVDQGGEARRPFAAVHDPVAEARRVVVAAAEPAVVEDEALRAKGGGAFGDIGQGIEGMVEIDGLPAIVVHRAWAAGIGPGHDPVAEVALEGGGDAGLAGLAIGEEEVGGAEGRAGRGVAVPGAAHLELAAAVGELLGEEAVAAGPGELEGAGLSGGPGAAAGGEESERRMLVPGAARAGLPEARAVGPRG